MKSLIDEYGLVGYPLGHSFSQKFFTEKFNKEHINAKYLMFEIPHLSELKNIIDRHNSLKGINITIPYKQEILEYLDEINEEAFQIGAVNVVKINKDNERILLKGYNTDILGFTNSLSPIINGNVHKKALVLGTGGASKAICHGLKNMGISFITVSRNKRKGCITYAEIKKEVLEEYQIIINCTPVGTFPNINNCPDIPYEFLTPNHLLYDLVYNPEETLFLKKGKEMGTEVKNGYEMLQLQALEAFKIWNE